MNVVVWVVSGLLAAMFLMAGIPKITKTKEQMLEGSSSTWPADFPGWLLKGIGICEIAAALGLILPGVTGIATWLVPAAAIGLVALMVGAAITHLRHKEYTAAAVNLVLLVLAAFVAIMRLGPQAF